jgi:hypothetical protein
MCCLNTAGPDTQRIRASDNVVANDGVFDKFTGDGILAHFPRFFSGPNAGLLALRAAERCHQAFQRLFLDYQEHFRQPPDQPQISIGIDFGRLIMTSVRGQLTVIGDAVVCACRLSDDPRGLTLVGNFGKVEILRAHPESVSFEQTGVDIKEAKSKKAAFQPLPLKGDDVRREGGWRLDSPPVFAPE